MKKPTVWWPLLLDQEEERAFWNFRKQMRDCSLALDHSNAQYVSDTLTKLMAQNLDIILERDGLPHLCHIINGWGNGIYQGCSMLDRIASFIHFNARHQPLILQCNPEGEFHPWQTFAYSVMAGVHPEITYTSYGITLQELASNSTFLNTQKGTELGHLLYALPHLVSDPHLLQFSLKGDIHNIEDLMNLAIEAHITGDFEVCRKFHLTEGLCAMAKKVEGFESYQEVANIFLEGQMEILFVVGAIFQEMKTLRTNENDGSRTLLDQLRSSLAMDDLVENHAYYAGHLIELGTLAASMGYSLKQEHWNAMIWIVNELNQILPNFLQRVSFKDCFLHFGHYRRAMTLLQELTSLDLNNLKTDQALFQRYTVDFDHIDSNVNVKKENYGNQDSLFSYSKPSVNTRIKFDQIIQSYTASAQKGLEPRGTFDHFRRIGPAHWPRAVHYEFLDYTSYIGIEIHLESELVLPLQEEIRGFIKPLEKMFPTQVVRWDPNWYNGNGRVIVIFDDQAPVEKIASGMQQLITETFAILDLTAKHLSIPN